MKKCDYCAKEISYFEQYCDEDCHRRAIAYYDMCERFGKVFSIINGICVFGIPIGLFISTFYKPAIYLSVASCVILGIMLLLLPFPTEGMISKHKIMGAMKRTRIVGLMVIALGMIIAGFAVFSSLIG